MELELKGCAEREIHPDFMQVIPSGAQRTIMSGLQTGTRKFLLPKIRFRAHRFYICEHWVVY